MLGFAIAQDILLLIDKLLLVGIVEVLRIISLSFFQIIIILMRSDAGAMFSGQIKDHRIMLRMIESNTSL